MCVLSVTSVVSNSFRPYGVWSAWLFCPRDSPNKNTGVGCHALLQGIFLTQGSNPHQTQEIFHISCTVSKVFTTEPLAKSICRLNFIKIQISFLGAQQVLGAKKLCKKELRYLSTKLCIHSIGSHLFSILS